MIFGEKMAFLWILKKNFDVGWFQRTIQARAMKRCEMMTYTRGSRFLKKKFWSNYFSWFYSIFCKKLLFSSADPKGRRAYAIRGQMSVLCLSVCLLKSFFGLRLFYAIVSCTNIRHHYIRLYISQGILYLPIFLMWESTPYVGRGVVFFPRKSCFYNGTTVVLQWFSG